MNRRQRTTTAALALLAAVGLTACDATLTVGDGAAGPRDTVTREIEPVSAVRLGTAGIMHVEVGDTPSLTITASERVLEEITAVVHGDTLEIELPGAWINPGPIEYELVLPALSSITVAGSADVDGDLTPDGEDVTVAVTGSGTVELGGATADAVTVSISGSGDVRLDDVAARSVDVEIRGSGTASLEGTTDELAVRIPGSGDVAGADLVARDATVEIRGSGTVTVHATGTLDARISGSGDVRYLGDPEVTSDVRGSGDVGPA